MDYTQVLGNTNELKCTMACMSLGYECSVPYGNGAKYDFILDKNGELYRIQCKCSNYNRKKDYVDTGSFYISTTCQTTNTKETLRHSYTTNQIDYFMTEFLEKVYIIPVSECQGTHKTLRLTPPQNGQKNYNHAEDYLIEKVLGYNPDYIISEINFKQRLNKVIMPEKIENDEDNIIEVQNNISEIKNIDSNTQDSIIEETKTKYYCSNCGKEVSTKGVLCVECAQIKSRKVERPSREELKALIRINTFTQIGEQFGVTDNTIRKWCVAYNLPKRKSEIKLISNEEWINV